MLQLFLTHLRGYGKQAVKAPIMMILEVICELTLPLVMSKIVDEAIPSGDCLLYTSCFAALAQLLNP